MSSQPDHEQAYRATVLEIVLRDGRSVRVTADESPPADLSVPFVVLTAWNPASRPRARWVNAVDQALLEAVVQARGCTTLPAVGRAGDGSWAEASVAVWGLAAHEAQRLGGDFGQNAVFLVTELGLKVLECPVPEPSDAERERSNRLD